MRWLRRPSTIRTQQLFRPLLESLERRDTPTNSVATAFAAGTLTITAFNDLVTKSDNNNSISLVGNGLGGVNVSGGTTTINGTKNFAGVNNIVLNMGLGNDTVYIFSVNITGSVTSNGGDGDDALNVGFNVADNSKFGSLTVKNGDGNDSFMCAGTLNVTGAVTINNGVGDSTMNFGVYNDDTIKLGSLSITNGDGFDTLTSTGSSTFTVLNACTINNGSGGSHTTLGNFGGKNPSVFVGGPLSITNTTGDDSIELGVGFEALFFQKGVTINNGNGISSIRFNPVSTAITGNLNVTTLDGATHAMNMDGRDVTVNGSITVKNGHGNSTTYVSGGITNKVTGAVSITNGSGDDSIAFGDNPNSQLTIGGAITVNSGPGTTVLDTYGSSQFASITANFGDSLGEDAFYAHDAKFKSFGPVTVNFGVGAARFALAATTNDIGGLLRVTCAPLSQENVDIGNSSVNTTNLKGFTYIGGAVATDLEFDGTVSSSGPVTITTLDGADSIDFDNSFTCTGTLSINTGAGADSVTVDTATLSINGDMKITTGDGADTVKLKKTSAGNLTIDTGNLNDVVWLDDSIFQATTINAGAGNDRVELEAHTNDNVSLTFNKPVTINMGSGDDYITAGLNQDQSDVAIFAVAPIKFDGGTGWDQLSLFPGFHLNVFPAGTPTKTGWELVE